MVVCFIARQTSDCPNPCTYGRVYPGHHASSNNETPVAIISLGLFPEVVSSQLPGIERAVHVDLDNFQIRLGGLRVRIFGESAL